MQYNLHLQKLLNIHLIFVIKPLIILVLFHSGDFYNQQSTYSTFSNRILVCHTCDTHSILKSFKYIDSFENVSISI